MANTRNTANTNTVAARKAPAKSAKAPAAGNKRSAKPVVETDDETDDETGESTGVNQWAVEQARAEAKPASNATRRYTALATALASLAKPGTTVAVRFADVNRLTGSTRGQREGCNVTAQWVRGIGRLYDVFGDTGLAGFGIGSVTVDREAGKLVLVGA